MPTDDLITLTAPEVRTFRGLELRDTDTTESGSYLEGRAVPYGTWQDVGWYMEMIRKGAFAKSIREAARKLPLLLWHDSRSFPVGVSEKWTESDDGLDVVWRLDTSDMAQEAARLAREGMLTGLSVGFIGISAERTYDEDTGVSWVERTEARLLEVSLTPTPAYAGAKVALVRSRERHINGSREADPVVRPRRRSAEVDALRAYLDRITS